MSGHIDILDQRERIGGPFAAALTLHIAVVAGLVGSALFRGHSDSFGAPDAGGASVGVEAVDSIPLPHRGTPNPVATDTKSEVPQEKAPPKQAPPKQEPPPKDAVRLKAKRTPRTQEQVAATQRRFRPFEELDPNQLTSKSAPAASSPIFSAMPGSGRVGTGANTTLGNRFAAYGAQIRQIVAQNWRTADVDARITEGPAVLARFDILRNGTVRNVAILQRSGIASLDNSVQRAILDSSPFPPLPQGFERDSATVEFTFELKR